MTARQAIPPQSEETSPKRTSRLILRLTDTDLKAMRYLTSYFGVSEQQLLRALLWNAYRKHADAIAREAQSIAQEDDVPVLPDEPAELIEPEGL